MNKIKVFLGGYINGTNAQNNNCYLLAKFLDKERFDVYTMDLYSEKLVRKPIKGVRVFRCFYPHKISIYFGYFWGIWKSDIVYLPKGELNNWNKFWLKALRKKSFKTIEGIFDEKNLKDAIAYFGSYKKFYNSFSYFDRIYSITKFVKLYNEKHYNIKSESNILYLGTDTEVFLNPNKTVTQLKNIIFIGALKERKGVYEILDLAKLFPTFNFYLVGNGEEKENIKLHIAKYNLSNVKLMGILNHEQLSHFLKDMDLHLFPSRSEGFGKVTFETAAAGIPSIVYSHYGANEWITDHKDGFVVDTFDEIREVIEELLADPTLLKITSKNAIDMAKRFDWKILVKKWEEEIKDIYAH